MKTASRILYVFAVIFAALSAVLLIAMCVVSIVNANNTELINWISNHIIQSFEIEEQYQHYVTEAVTRAFVTNGISYAFSAIPCVVAIPVFLSARKALEDITNAPIGKFVASIVFGVLTTKFGVAAGALAIVARAVAIKHQKKSKVVDEQ